MTGRDASGGGWSAVDNGGAAADDEREHDEERETKHPFRIAGTRRYEAIDVAGRGGMGEVLVARDRRLGREVALKRISVHDHDRALARRLAREAWITARLEHPSIVPVHDAGESEDGRLYYTMRLIHGRSLGEAMREAGTPAQRLALIRHFLAACEALAYAHSHGIVHRDLKPANVMVGGFGETQIVDWGLATFARDDTARAFETELGLAADVTQASAIGTPAYMAPEQARGEPADPRADVWALGAILHEIVVDARLLTARDAAGALAELRRDELDRTRLHASTAAPELRAIIERATAIDKRKRYSDAGDLASDVARYLDGRRVHAHEYSTLELTRRLLRRLRVPILVATAALLAGGTALALSVRRIERARARAIVAEAETRRALDESRRTSGRALERQAVLDLAGGATAEAELLAAHALEREESPDARGVLAAVRAGARLGLAETIELPGCERVLPATWGAALCLDADHLAWWDLEPLRERWRQPLRTRDAAVVERPGRPSLLLVLDAPNELLVNDAARGDIVQRHHLAPASGWADKLAITSGGDLVGVTEGRDVDVVSLERGVTISSGRGCGLGRVAAIAPTRSTFVLVCDTGELRRLDPALGTNTVLLTAPALASIHPLAATASPDERTILVGGARGDVVRIDLPTAVVAAPRRALDGAITRLVITAGAHVLIDGDTGGIGIWDEELRTELVRLPEALSDGVYVDARGISTGGRRAGRWTLPERVHPRRFVAPSGLADVAIAPDGRSIAGARGDGRITLWERASGRVEREIVLGASVVKSIDFSPDGRSIAAVMSAPLQGPRRFDRATGDELGIALAPYAARRVTFTADGSMLAVHFAPPLRRWRRDGAIDEIVAPEMWDVSHTEGRKAQLLLSVDGGVWRLEGTSIHEIARAPDAHIIAAWDRSARFATGEPLGVTIHEPDGTRRPIENSVGRHHDLIVSPDGRYLLAARNDGTIPVWRADDGQLVATLRGHTQRVAHLTFAPDGQLASAGWDGAVLLWDLRALELSPAALAADAKAAWGLDLGLTLASM